MVVLANDPYAASTDAEVAGIVNSQHQQHPQQQVRSENTPMTTHGAANPTILNSDPSVPRTVDFSASSMNAMGGNKEGPRRGSTGSMSSEEGMGSPRVPLSQRERRMSKEWDAAKTPPSRFQKVEGSIFATPASRDGHVARNKIHGFKEKVAALSGKK